MKKVAFPIMLFAAIAALPVGKASAQDPLAGALIGGALGGVVGGVVSGGKAGGVAVGAILGATAGAVIARQGQRKRNGYYAYNRGCWIERRDHT